MFRQRFVAALGMACALPIGAARAAEPAVPAAAEGSALDTRAGEAAAPPPAAPVALDIGVGTVFPLYIGAQAVLEVPWRFSAQLEVGWMPTPYVDAIDGALSLFGVYPDEVSQLIREALDSSLVLRPSLGWRPFPALGLELAAGYTFLTLGGGLGPREVIESISGRNLPDETRNEIPLHSTLHNLHLRAAWRFLLAERWVLRASLEFMHCLASSSGIDYEARRPAGERVVQEVNAAIDAYLNAYYTEYVNVPLLGLSLAYRLP